MSTGKVLKDSACSLAARIWMALARGVCILAISQVLGPSAYGSYAIVLNTFVIMVMLGTAGLEQANTYLAGKGLRIETLLVNAVWSSLALGCICIAGLLPIVNACSGRLLEPDAVRLVHEAMLFVPLAVLGNQSAGIIIGAGKFRYYALAEFLKWGACLAASVLLIATGRLTPRTGLLAFYGSVGAAAILHSVILQRSCDAKLLRRWYPDLSLARDCIRYGMQAFSVNAVNLLNFRCDFYLLKYFRSPAEVGLYSVGVNLAEVLLYLARSMNTVLFSRVASDDRQSESLTPRLARMTIAVVTTCVFVLLLVKDTLIVAVLGEDYISCSNIVSLLIPGILAQSVTLILVGDLLGSRDLRPVLKSGLLCFVVMTALDLVLIPRGGFLAAALASAIAYAVQAAHLLNHHGSRHRLEVLSYLVLRPADVLALRRNVSQAFGGAKP